MAARGIAARPTTAQKRGSSPTLHVPRGGIASVPAPGDTHLFAVLADVGVDLVECTQHVELGGVQARLLSEVGVHVLVADGGELGNVCVIPAGRKGQGGP